MTTTTDTIPKEKQKFYYWLCENVSIRAANLWLDENFKQFLLSAISKTREELIEKIEMRAWVHIDEMDSKIKLDGKIVKHSEDFGKGWNANADDMVDWLLSLKEKQTKV